MTRRRPRAKTSNNADFGMDEEMENININEKKVFNGMPLLNAAEEKKIMKIAIDFSEKLGYDCSNIIMAQWSSYTGE